FYTNVVDGLNDKSPHVQRVATELLIKYPVIGSVDAALDVLHKTNPDYDNHLFYTARLALRNLLRNENLLKEAIAKQWNETDAALIAGVMVDVNSPNAAAYLTDFMKKNKLPDDKVPQAYGKIVQYTPANKLQTVIDGAFGNPDANIDQKA